MGIFTRIIRLCKADMHGVMDQMEDQGLLLKQHLRDMETALNRKEMYLKQMKQSKNNWNRTVTAAGAGLKKLKKTLALPLKRIKTISPAC